MKLKIQIIDADYFLNNGKPVVRIFGKTEDGTAVCGMHDELQPYFYVQTKHEPDTAAAEKIAGMKEVRSVEQQEKYLPFGYQERKTRLLKITLTNPQDVPRVRDRLMAEGIAHAVFEADIMFKYRFLVDKRIKGMQWVEIDCEREQKTVKSKVPIFRIHEITPVEKAGNADMRYMAFDIECIPSDAAKPVDAKRDPIVMISMSFRPAFRGHASIVLAAKPVAMDGVKGFYTEKEMLAEFLSVIDSFDPDILTGYNINSFDLPYLVERLRQHRLPACFGRSDKDAYSRTAGLSQEFAVSGRIVADPYQILKRDPWVKFHRYDLKTVAKKLLQEDKHDVEYGEMPSLWNGDREKLTRFIEYSRKDAELSMKLLVDKGMLDKFFELSKISGLLLQDTFGGQTRRIETMLLHEFRTRNFVMPAAPARRELQKSAKDREEQGLKGATVLEPKKGLHADGCVFVLDFKSLYPSIMRTYNISPDTAVAEKDKNVQCHQSPSGAYFVDEPVYKGIFPDILTRLTETRSDARKLMKTKTGEEKRILNAKQLALKDMANSFYGYVGYMRARLYMIDVANSVTAYGRENLEKTKKLIEENFSVEVIYADSITGDRFVTLLNMENEIEIKNIELLFEQHKENMTETPDGKERILLDGYRALTINPETREPEWATIREVIRHKTGKKIYRVSQKFGETVVTEDHSLITDNGGILEETKPAELHGKKLIRVEKIPDVKEIKNIDLYGLLKNYKYAVKYKGRTKTARFHCDNDFVWFGWTNRKNPVRARRFIEVNSPEFDALCRLMGAYIAEGPASTFETATRYGTSISSSDTEWLKELQTAYHAIFDGVQSCVIQSNIGVRELSYGDKKILYEDKTYKLQMMNSLAAAIFSVLCGQKSYGKKIPSFIFHVPESKQKLMLQHMLKGDGSVTNNFRYTTKSLNLASCLSLLLTLLGKKFVIRFRGDKLVYSISTCSEYNKLLRTRIIEEPYSGYVYDLAVDKNHMFVDACGQILLHNTDSAFVKTKITNLDDVKELGEKISKYVTESLPGELELQFEKIYRTFLILTKKRYAGWKFEHSDGKWSDEIEMRGIETVRRDWCQLVSDTMMEVLNIILKEGDVQKAMAYVKDVLDKLKKGQIPMEKLTVIKGITQSVDSYKGMLPHIELARKMTARSPREAPKIGDRIGFIIIRGNQMLSKRAEDPTYATKHGLQIDSDYYIESQLFPPIERIFASMGVEKSEIMGNGHQATFGEIFGTKARVKKHDTSIAMNNADAGSNEGQGKAEIILEGWEDFVCSRCGKSHRRMPLVGVCECGGQMLIAWHGSAGTKAILK